MRRIGARPRNPPKGGTHETQHRSDSHHPCRQPDPAGAVAHIPARQGGRRGVRSRPPMRECLKECVAEVVRQQAEIGLDVISDGEFGKAISWAQYALFRLGGFERRPFKPNAGNPFTRGADRTRFAEFYAELEFPRQGRDRLGFGLRRPDHLHRAGRAAARHRQLQVGAARGQGRRKASCRSRRRRASFPTARTNTTRTPTSCSRRSATPCAPNTR